MCQGNNSFAFTVALAVVIIVKCKLIDTTCGLVRTPTTITTVDVTVRVLAPVLPGVDTIESNVLAPPSGSGGGWSPLCGLATHLGDLALGCWSTLSERQYGQSRSP